MYTSITQRPNPLSLIAPAVSCRRFLLIACLLILHAAAPAQQTFTVSGSIRDTATGEVLIGASVYIRELKNVGVITNAYGFYSLTIPRGQYTLAANSVGYAPFSQPVTADKNVLLNIALLRASQNLEEVTVSNERKNENVTRPLMGVEKLSIQQIKNIPVIFGEKDVLKTLQLLPGIKSAGEGNSGFYVRGGAADQNLILLDEAPVYNPSHLLGFFSVFNSDAIKDVTVYKGGMPAEYGGRLSSVIDLKMNEGNNQKTSVSGGIGLISSRLSIEGPIKKGKSSFIISARRTYADLFLKAAKDTVIKNSTLYFYDINAKANIEIDKKNKLFISGYFGRDDFGYGKTFGFNWGNATATLRWNHLVTNKLFSNTSLIYSNYSYRVHLGSGDERVNITSRIKDYNVKEDLQWYAASNHTIKFGLNSIYHEYVPGIITAGGASSVNSKLLQNKNAWENAVYVSDDWRVTPALTLDYGVRLNVFSLLGPGTFYSYTATGAVSNSRTYTGRQFVTTYFNAEPRIAASYTLNDQQSVKASYTRNTQNVHLLSNSTTSTPTDLWIPSSNNVRPEIADQFSAGYFRNFNNNTYEFSTEIYYKLLQHQIDYKNGADLNANENVESQLLYGNGRAYGIELFFKKRYGRLNGWIGYTLSRIENKIDGINNNRYFPAKQDRTHDVSVVGIYEASKKWTLSATWVYNTGNAATFPAGKYEVNGQVINYYTERNGYRFPPYHRLDLGATLQRRKTARFESSWSFSVYNAYARENAYTIEFRKSTTDPTKTEAVRTALFKIIPAVTYNFKF